MPLRLSQVRIWFAIAAVLSIAIVAGVYLYAHHRVQSALKQVPGKMGLEIQQTANGFSISKSAEGRTLFRVQASKVVQFKQGGRAELHDVQITIYGRDADRFDRIRGAQFEYDQRSGDVTAAGAVQIDLEANPDGGGAPDQAAPAQQKNPIQITTTGLVFNQQTGNASAKDKVDFSLPQATGSAIGVDYVGKTGVMTLISRVDVTFLGSKRAHVEAAHGTITKEPRVILLDQVRLRTGTQQSEAEAATIYLRPDNSVERILEKGAVHVKSGGVRPMEIHSSQLELVMAPQHDVLDTAIFSGDVHMESTGKQPMLADAGRVTLQFAGKNVLQKIRAEENVKLVSQQQASAGKSSSSSEPQNLEMTAPRMDFLVAGGRKLQHAETSGAAQVVVSPVSSGGDEQRTTITAGKFEAKFDESGQLSSVHGAPNARVVSRNAAEPERVSSSDSLDMLFQPGKGAESIVQQGHFAYFDGERKAWGDKARYTTDDQVLQLTGSPRLVDGGLTATARTMHFNRTTGDAVAEGEVKSTYSDLKPQPNGALLASGDPIHVTSQTMRANRSPSVATYSGDARLWQNANVIEAPTIEFNRDRRSVDADGTVEHPVSTVLIQTDKTGNATPIAIAAKHFIYTDGERRAHYSGGVEVKASDMTLKANEMDAYLKARGNSTADQAGRLERIVANERVVITQPARHGNGEQLIYTSADDRFVLSGGTPSIFDAEHGQVTGVSLTLFRHDDRVLVEGNDSAPTRTHTRVAR